jgi:hypothetical protein
MGIKKTPDGQSKTQSQPAYAQQECAQCQAQQEGQITPSVDPQQRARSYGRVIILEQYLADRVQALSMQLTELQQSAGILMYQLIREPDQSCAHQLQRTIGRMDGEQVRLNQRLRTEKRRLQMFRRS